MIYTSIEMRSECEKCGKPLMINGPLRKVPCKSCQKTLKIHPMSWKTLLEGLIEDIKNVKPGEGRQSHTFAADFQRDYTAIRENPCCFACSAPLKNIPSSLKGEKIIPCPKCSHENIAMEAPRWLKKVIPEISVLINASLLEDEGKSEKITARGKPIHFTCPACSGNLKLDGSSRLINCEYCGGDIYLPDDLWLIMHPVDTVQKWYIGFVRENGEIKNKKWDSDLLEAAYDEDDEMGIEALDKGADPNVADEDGRSALFLATATGAAELVEKLIETGADIDCADNYGTTAFNIASYNGNMEIVKALIKAGANLDHQNKIGITALNGAAKMGHGEIVKLLLKEGANPGLKNKEGQSPLDRAREDGHRDIVSLLKKYDS